MDDAREAREAMKTDDLILDIQYEIKQMAKDNRKSDLEAIASVLEMSIERVRNRSVEELRQIINKHVKENPYRFVKDGEVELLSDKTYRQWIALKAIKEGVLEVSRDQKRISWGASKEVAKTIPVGRKPVEWLTDYLASDDGTIMLEEISRLLDPKAA